MFDWIIRLFVCCRDHLFVAAFWIIHWLWDEDEIAWAIRRMRKIVNRLSRAEDILLKRAEKWFDAAERKSARLLDKAEDYRSKATLARVEGKAKGSRCKVMGKKCEAARGQAELFIERVQRADSQSESEGDVLVGERERG